MVNNFSVDSVGLYINWAKTSLLIILGSVESTYKKPPIIKVASYIFWRNLSVKLIPHYLIDIIYKIVAKAITFRKIAIVPNGNKLMFQVIFIFSDWILTEQIIASSNPFCLGGNRFSKNSTRSFEWGTGAWVKKHRFNDFLGMWTP